VDMWRKRFDLPIKCTPTPKVSINMDRTIQWAHRLRCAW
jgi:hypothetical protein